ncbi:hypothetical protein [Azonexus hydrophilus]|uniref:Major tropism determinant N-terminal domain-containing protein n=1 Tax=Azonexus hydrophilus TaxID=418702 RepID=A0ABZ2XGC2_9RHOO
MPLLNHMKLRRGAAAVRAIYHKRAVLSGPTLGLDFTGQQYIRMDAGEAFGDIITFTRASAATRFNASGVLETVGNNVPRIDYDPVTLACRGLLIEEQRTNMLLNSATLATQSVAVSGVAKTLTFTGTGSIALSGAHTATLNGTGANNRVALTFTPSAGTLTLTVTGDVRNAQLEVGAFATSWIPTTGAQATRAADVVSINTLSPWYNQQEGTIFAEASTAAGGSSRVVVCPSDGTLSNRMQIVINSTTSNGAISVAGAVQLDFHRGSSGSNGDVQKCALAYKENASAVSVNNASLAEDTSCLIPAINRMNVGSYPNGSYLNGYIRKLRYFPKRLTNAELQALTA